jgi:DivIVA domain-containing protein
MTGDAFQLTSHDVRAQEFQRVLRGYDPAQVEEFKQRLSEEIDRLVRERVQLDERVRGMSEQLKSYRDRERAMNDALVSAQQMKGDLQAQIDRERDLALREARGEADKLLLDAHAEVDRLLRQAHADQQRIGAANDQARRQFQTYVASFRQLLERHLTELAVLGGDGAPAPEPAPPHRSKG